MTVTYREAINRAIGDALEADEDVFLLGEDVAAAGGVFKVTQGLLDRFGEKRVLDTPISEQAIIGCAIGAAVQGLRPLAELMFADFAGVAFDQISNQLAKYRFFTGGQVSLPVTIRMANGGGGGFGPQHSQCVENWFLNVPGLKIVVPATPVDAYGLLRSAVQDPDPVLYFEHKGLFNLKADDFAGGEALPLGQAKTVCSGSDVTLVATQLMRHRALEAVEILAAESVSVELIDPRTLVPFDVEMVAGSLERTNCLVVVQEAPFAGSWGATLIAELMRTNFESFDAPPVLVAAHNGPIPYAQTLENEALPSVDRIADAVRRAVNA